MLVEADLGETMTAEEAILDLLDFIRLKRIYILSEFESGGHELVEKADALDAIIRKRMGG